MSFALLSCVVDAFEAALREDVELDEALKREILELEARLGTVDHFALFGLPPEADPAQVKATFLALCRRLHPDRHFRKRLGSFKARLSAVFEALSKAHQTLIDPDKRGAYLAATPSARKPLVRERAGRMTFKSSDLQFLAQKKGK